MAASTPSFSSSSNIDAGTVSTANTNRNGSGTVTTLTTGGTNGTRIERILAKAQGTTTAGMLRFFLFNASGTFVHMFLELPVSAIVASGTVATWEGERVYGALRFFVLPANWTIRAATNNAESFTIEVETTA